MGEESRQLHEPPLSELLDDESSTSRPPLCELLDDETSTSRPPLCELLDDETSTSRPPLCELLDDETSTSRPPLSELLDDETSTSRPPLSELLDDETSTSRPPLCELLNDETSTSRPPPFAPNTLLGWDLPQACFSHTQSEPLTIQAGSSLYHSSPLLNQAGPSHTQAGSSNTPNIVEFPYGADLCPTELDSEIDLTSPSLDHTFSYDDELFPELDSHIDLTTPLSETDPSNIQEDNSYFRTLATQIDPSQIQAGPYQAQAGPSNTRTMSELESEEVKCIHCEKVFARKNSLKRHVRIHHEETPIIQCYHCGRYYSRKDHLDEHIRNKHSDIELDSCVSYRCSNCGSMYSKKANLTRHLRLGCSIPPQYSCSQCSFKAHQESNLKQHIGRTHRSDGCEGYTCPKCGRTYTLKSNLNRHLRLECGIPPQLSCSQCSFKTRRKNNLKLHMDRIHRSDRCGPYTCPKCGRTYKFKGNLTRHLRLECGIPPQLSCSQCSFKTHRMSNLKRHMDNIHRSNFHH